MAQDGPVMVVEDDSGLELSSGATIDFGSAEFGAFRQRSVFIKSVGTTTLAFDTSRSGPQAAEFTWLPAHNQGLLSPNSLVEIVIKFRPVTLGTSVATLRVASNDPNEPETRVTLTGTVHWAEMRVEQPADTTALTSGDGRSFGEVAVDGDAFMTFTLKNPGGAYLRNISATLSGTHATEFKITKLPTSPLAPFGSTTLVVRHSPQAVGTRTATLRLTSNAALPSPSTYLIPLSSTGALSLISLSAPQYRAVHGDAQALVTLTRSPAHAPATVRLETASAEAVSVPPIGAAQAGLDYVARSGEQSVVGFVAGETQKTVPITLLAPAGLEGTNRHLNLTLSQPSLGAKLGAQTTARLRILGPDSTPPTLSIAAPAAAPLMTTAPVLLSGVAGDALGVERVEVVLNGALPALAVVGAPVLPSEYPFSLPLLPLEGPNVLVVTAYDVFGNSTAVTRSFTFTRRQLLTLETMNGDTGGLVTMTATPMASATALVVKTGSAPPTTLRTSLVAQGTVVRLTAMPKTGFVFSRWTSPNEPGLVLTKLGDVLTFTMPEVDVKVTAEFVPTPFAPPAGASASIYSLLGRQHGQLRELVVIPFEQQGYLTGALTAAGSFSGRLLINGQSVPVVATLYANAPAVFTVAGQKVDALPLPQQDKKLRLVNNQSPEQPLRAVIANADGSGIFSRTGRRAKRPPAAMLNSSTRGYYTFYTYPAPGTPAPQPASAYPQGHGYATLHLLNTGQITLTGVLADATSVTMGSSLVAGDFAPVFIPLPTPGGTTKNGLATGELKFAPDPQGADVDGLLKWYRPAAVSPNILLYPQGWPGGIDIGFAGGLYDASMSVQTALALPAPTPGQGNAALTFGDAAGLAVPMTVTNFNVTRNSVVKLPPSDKNFTLTLDPAMGYFNGSFTPSWAGAGGNAAAAPPKPSFRGVILQKPSLRFGAGFYISPVPDGPAQVGGGVVLER